MASRLCGMGRAAVFEQDDVPSSPLRLDHREEIVIFQ